MPYRGRIPGTLQKDSRLILAAVQKFLKTHTHGVTVRVCLYYCVSIGRRSLPSTEEKYERKLYRLVSKARIAGEIEDEPFQDARCEVMDGGTSGYANLDEYMQPPDPRYYERNYWQDQAKHVTEVWLEKNTIRQSVIGVVRKWDCTLRVAAGFYGRAFLYQAAKELAQVKEQIVILYLGDFDPSGLRLEHVAREGNEEKHGKRSEGLADILVKQFGWTYERFEKQVTWLRVAATHEDLKNPQLQKYTLSVKQLDTRSPAYQKKYGKRCLEIEALDIAFPGSLAKRLDAAIQKHGVNVAAWKRSEAKETREKKTGISIG
jgi:hypothetical protein